MLAYYNTRPDEKEKENRKIVHTLKNLHTKVWHFISNQTHIQYTIKHNIKYSQLSFLFMVPLCNPFSNLFLTSDVNVQRSVLCSLL